MERRNGAHLVDLGLDCFHHFGMLMSDVHVHQLAREIYVALTVFVPEAAALRARHDERVNERLG